MHLLDVRNGSSSELSRRPCSADCCAIRHRRWRSSARRFIFLFSTWSRKFLFSAVILFLKQRLKLSGWWLSNGIQCLFVFIILALITTNSIVYIAENFAEQQRITFKKSCSFALRLRTTQSGAECAVADDGSIVSILLVFFIFFWSL